MGYWPIAALIVCGDVVANLLLPAMGRRRGRRGKASPGLHALSILVGVAVFAILMFIFYQLGNTPEVRRQDAGGQGCVVVKAVGGSCDYYTGQPTWSK